MRAIVRTGTRWGSAQTIAPGGTTTDVAAAVGRNGDAALAWYDGEGRLRIAARPAGGSLFGTPDAVPGSPSTRRTLRERDPPGLAVDGAGTAYVVSQDLVVHARSREGAWTHDAGARAALEDGGRLPNFEPGDVARIGAAANAAGDLVVGLVAIRDGELFAPRVVSRRAGGPWAIALAAFQMADRPAVGIDGGGTVTAAWAANEPSTGVFRAEGPAGAELGRKVRVVDLSSTIPGQERAVTLAVAESGAAVLATIYGRTAAVHKPAGGGWDAPAPIDPRGGPVSVGAAIDPGGAAAVIAGANVFTHARTGRWSRPWRIAAEGGGERSLVAVDEAGFVIPVWDRQRATVTLLAPFLASNTRGNTPVAGPARLLSAVPLYANGTPERCVAAVIKAAQRNRKRTVSLWRCAPAVAVRIRNDGGPQPANVRVSGADFRLKLRPGTRRYVLRGLKGGRHTVTLFVANVPRGTRRVRLLGCPGHFC